MIPAGTVHPFDRLRLDVLWEADVRVAILGGIARLGVDADEEGPAPWQRATFDEFMKVDEQLAPAVNAALADYCASVLPEVVSRTPAALRAGLTADALLGQIHPRSVHIGLLERVPWRVGLLYDCDWDPGHGLGVWIIDGHVAQVGPQDICL